MFRCVRRHLLGQNRLLPFHPSFALRTKNQFPGNGITSIYDGPAIAMSNLRSDGAARKKPNWKNATSLSGSSNTLQREDTHQVGALIGGDESESTPVTTDSKSVAQERTELQADDSTSLLSRSSFPSLDTPEGQLLRERAKWFGHVIPSVSLVVLGSLRSDITSGNHLPEKGHLLILDDWDGFVNRRSAVPQKEKRQQWFTSQDTIQQVLAAIQAFLVKQEEQHGIDEEDAMAMPLLILIPSQLDAVTATQEQMVLEQAILMQSECTSHNLDRIASVWVMNSDEAWHWREALIEGSVSATWPLRPPQQPGPLTPRALLQQPPIPERKLNHIMRNMDLQDIHAVFSNCGGTVVLPRRGHLLLLRDRGIMQDQPHKTAVEKVAALMPLVERAMKVFVSQTKSSSPSADLSVEEPGTDDRHNGEEPPLTLLLLSFSLSFSEAEDLQRLLHYSLLMTPTMQQRHFPADPVVWVLTGEQKEKLTRAYIAQRVGTHWTNAPPAIEASPLETVAPQSTVSSAEDSHSNSAVTSSSDSTTSAMGDVVAETDPPMAASVTSMPPWTPPDDIRGVDGDPITPILSAELVAHGEIETLWSSAPGFPVGVNSLKSMLRPKVFGQLQDQLHHAKWLPPRLHILACHAGAEQLEQNTDVMFKDLLKTAADYFHVLTEKETLRDAINGTFSNLEEKNGLEDPDEDSSSGTADMSYYRKDSGKIICDGRFVKITILLYTDLIIQSEVELLRAMLQCLYNQLPHAAQEIILAIEVVNADASIATAALERLKEAEATSVALRKAGGVVRETEVVQPEEDEIPPSSETENNNEEGGQENVLQKDDTTRTSKGGKSSAKDKKHRGPEPLSVEALTEALQASSQFLKLLQQREKSIRAEMRAAAKTAAAATVSTSSAITTGMTSEDGAVTSKAELKALLEDAVEEVTARHEQAMSHLVNTMSKMVGAWTSETFMEELNATIKQGIEPMQEHLSEWTAASAKLRRGVMSEDMGKEILRKLDTLLAVVSLKRMSIPVAAMPSVSSTLLKKAIAPPPLPGSGGDLSSSAIAAGSSASHHNAPVTASAQGTEQETKAALKSISGSDASEMPPQVDTSPSSSSVSSPPPPPPPTREEMLRITLIFSTSEIRFLTNIAKKQVHSRLESSRRMAKAWMEAEKIPVPDMPLHFFVNLPDEFVESRGGDALEVLKEVIIHLIECSYLRKPFQRPRRRKTSEKKFRQKQMRKNGAQLVSKHRRAAKSASKVIRKGGMAKSRAISAAGLLNSPVVGKSIENVIDTAIASISSKGNDSKNTSKSGSGTRSALTEGKKGQAKSKVSPAQKKSMKRSIRKVLQKSLQAKKSNRTAIKRRSRPLKKSISKVRRGKKLHKKNARSGRTQKKEVKKRVRRV